MPELGYVAYLIALGYATGLLWYSVFGHQHTNWMRIAAFPFLGIVIGEAIWPGNIAAAGPVLFNVHIVVALVASFIGSLVDVSVQYLLHEERPFVIRKRTVKA